MPAEEPKAIGITPPYPAVNMLLARRKLIPPIGAVLIAIVIACPAYRLGWPELYAVAVLCALCCHFILRVSIEVVQLVAETLMPQ